VPLRLAQQGFIPNSTHGGPLQASFKYAPDELIDPVYQHFRFDLSMILPDLAKKNAGPINLKPIINDVPS
jgi:hypothetical protein